MPAVKEGECVSAIDEGIRNKWRWEWLSETDENKTPHREWCVKLDRAGVCQCTICNSELKYGSNGKKRLNQHANGPSHQKNTK